MVTVTTQQRADLIGRLRASGCVWAEDEADLLVAEAVDARQLAVMADRRVAGEPLEQVLGWAEFLGLRLAVGPGVFVPRRRTELLARVTADRCAPGRVVVDLCCGVGAVAAAVAVRVPAVELYAVDLDPAAVAAARTNLESVTGGPIPAGSVLCGDLYAPLPARLRGRVEVIAANAPYVPSAEIALMPTEARDHERRAALDGGADGLDIHRRVVAGATEWLAAGGTLLIETSRRQAPTDLQLLRAAGFTAEVVTDDDVDGTVVIGRTPAPRAS